MDEPRAHEHHQIDDVELGARDVAVEPERARGRLVEAPDARAASQA